MTAVELGVLEACHELVLRQQEMLPHLAAALGVRQEEVFYTWAFRRCEQRGRLPASPWVYFFHGMECDLRNTEDRRFLRVDFGPGGRVDTFTGCGVLQFIMTSAPPWPDFGPLKARFARGDSSPDIFSGDLTRFGVVWDGLRREGCVEVADRQLLLLREKYTTVGPDGIRYTRFPESTDEKVRIDSSVADRETISEHGRRLLQAGLAEESG